MIPIPPITKTWYKCPKCGQKLALVAQNASCYGVFVRCKKCRIEIEIKVNMDM